MTGGQNQTERRFTKLPGTDEMRERLERVLDDSYMAEYLFPLLLKSAGRELNAMGVVMCLQLAIADFLARFKGNPALPVLQLVLAEKTNALIEALVDEPDIRAEAVAFWKKVQQG